MSLILELKKQILPNHNLSTTKILTLATAGTIGLYLAKIWHSYSFFEDRGVPTPPYEFFFGNFRQLRKENKNSKVLREWTEKYGKIYGYYQGHTPFLVVSDLDFINEVFIKQYANFSAKKRQPLDREDDASKVMIISATKGRWKRMRNIMNPTFSSAKLKELNPVMEKCIERLINKINDNLDKEINIMNLFKKFTMDTIWNCGFGIDKDMQFSNLGDLYIQNSDESLEDFVNYSPLMYIATYFSEFRRYLVYMHLMFNHLMIKLFGERFVDPLFWIREEVIEVVDARRASNIRKKDYLQLLMDAESTSNNVNFLDENEKLNFSQLYLSKKLSLDEIKMNLSIFLMAGSESTSIAITVLFHILAMMPDEQEKLFHEIEEHYLFNNIDPTYDNIQKLEYLDMFVKESLRMWPIANPACTRRCVKRTNIKGIDIPEDLTIIVDVMSLHFDPELWGPIDPKIFYPNRFATRRNPLAFMAFGVGPRNCIGIKFAMLELKMCVVKLLKNFQVKPTENTPELLDFVEGVIGILSHPVNVKFVRRNHDQIISG